MNNYSKEYIDYLVKIRKRYWKEYESIKPEVEELTRQWRICIERVNPDIYSSGDCHQIWQFEKKLMKDKFNVNWPTENEINPDTKFD